MSLVRGSFFQVKDLCKRGSIEPKVRDSFAGGDIVCRRLCSMERNPRPSLVVQGTASPSAEMTSYGSKG